MVFSSLMTGIGGGRGIQSNLLESVEGEVRRRPGQGVTPMRRIWSSPDWPSSTEPSDSDRAAWRRRRHSTKEERPGRGTRRWSLSVSHSGRLKRQTFVISQLQRPEVQGQGVGKAVLPLETVGRNRIVPPSWQLGHPRGSLCPSSRA